MKIILAGYGRMGQLIGETAVSKGAEIVKAINIEDIDFFDSKEKIADLIIDFSNPAMTEKVIAYAKATGTTLLTGTTGLSEELTEQLRDLAKTVPVGASYNYSYGIAVLKRLVKMAAEAMGDEWDIELIEAHHNKKVDAPSGTAVSLLSCIDPENEREKVYGREGVTGERTKREIGVHVIRGGTEAGEHTVSFYGNGEVVTISHHAQNRQIFVDGAVKAAFALMEKPAGLYTAEDLFAK